MNARAAVELHYGVGAVDRFSPDDMENVWLPAVKQAVGDAWDAYKVRRARRT